MATHPFDVVDAVLQAQDNCIAGEMGRDGAGRLFGVGGLDAEQHPMRAAHAGRIGRGGKTDGLGGLLGLNRQAVAVDGFDMSRAADQRDVRSATRQHGAEIAADGAGAHHRDLALGGVVHRDRPSDPIPTPTKPCCNSG
jgi:hypothetical protein